MQAAYAEESLLVMSICRDDALILGHAYGQNAIVLGEKKSGCQVIILWLKLKWLLGNQDGEKCIVG